MAETSYDPQKVQAILQDYLETLEVLTINSKPLINDLTMAADRYKPLATQIVGVIESRLFEVPTAVSLFVSRVVCLYYCMFILFGTFVVHGVCVCAGPREEGDERVHVSGMAESACLVHISLPVASHTLCETFLHFSLVQMNQCEKE